MQATGPPNITSGRIMDRPPTDLISGELSIKPPGILESSTTPIDGQDAPCALICGG